MSGSDVNTTPLIAFFESLGYSADASNGRKVIKSYISVEDELSSLCNGVGLRDISHYGILELKGTDVLDYLHRISTNDLRTLSKENIQYTLFTTEKGRIIDLAAIVNFESQQLCICSSPHKQKLKSWIEKYAISDDVTINDTGDKYALLELLGPHADSFAMLIAGNMVNTLQPRTFKVVNSEGMLFFLLKLQRNKYWFISDQENGKQLINYMLGNRALFDFTLIGEDAYNIYRIEHGIPAAPYELSDEYNPHEARLTEFLDTKKGCYIGQEVIARLETYDKVQRTLMGIKFSGNSAPGNYELVDTNGAEAGRITSWVYSPRCGSNIGLAYIRKVFASEGQELQVKNSDIKVQVKNLPFRK